MAVSGRRGKGGNPAEALRMAEWRLNETERRVQQAFMKSGFFNGLALSGVVVAAYMVLRELPDWDGRPDAALPLSYAPVPLPRAAPPLRLAQVVGLDHGAHRPVEQENPPRQERFQQCETLGPGATGSEGGGWWRDDWHERSYEKSPGLKRHGASVLAIV